jgi:aryl-alcohol dehydrogenase-like predicted oxidoreductase
MGTEYIDIYFCHWFDPETPIEETMRAMDDLVRQGKVLYLGVSNWSAAQIAESLRICGEFGLNRISVNQPSYNMFDRYIERETIPLCEKHGIGQIVYSPMAQGVLTGKYRPGQKPAEGTRAANPNAKAEVTVWDYLHEDLLRKVELLRPIAAEMSLTLSQLALAWVLLQKSVASALIGASKPGQIEENAKASGIELPAEAQQKIEKVLKIPGYAVKHNIVG